MSLLDHSFHDLDMERWLDNFSELTEPEYVVPTPDDIRLSPECAELCALLKKDTTYDRIVDTLNSQKIDQLYWWMLKPETFPKDTEIICDDSRYVKFLSEFISGFVLYRNQWDRKQLGVELKNFIKNWNQPYNKRPTRLKKCVSCGYNITDLFTMKLTADNILDDSPVSVVCPHCSTLNYFKY